MALTKPPGVAASAYRSAKWDELVAGGEPAEADAPLLEKLVQWHEVYDAALAEIEAGGGVQTAYQAESGDLKAMPQLATMKMASSEIRNIMRQLALPRDGAQKAKMGLVVSPFERMARQYGDGARRRPAAEDTRSA